MKQYKIIVANPQEEAELVAQLSNGVQTICISRPATIYLVKGNEKYRISVVELELESDIPKEEVYEVAQKKKSILKILVNNETIYENWEKVPFLGRE